MESRFTNFRAEGSSQELQRLTAPTSRFFKKTIFTLIYNGHISQKGLSSHDVIPIKQFSLLYLALLHDEVTCDENFSPFFNKDGLKSYDSVETIFKANIWFCMTVFNPTWHSQTIISKAIVFLRERCHNLNFRAQWQSAGFQRGPASLKIATAIHNLGALIASLANHIPEERVTQALFSDPDDNEFLVFT